MALDPERLRASGALLGAQIALGTAIDRDAIDPTGIDQTTADLLVRLHLTDGNRLRAVELCEQLLKSPSHISRIVDRAEAAGLVRREPDPDDRRAQQIVLQQPGVDLVDEITPAFDAVLQRSIFDRLSSTEIETLVDLLGRIEAGARS